MSTALTLDLSDEVLQGASVVAAATERGLAEVLEEALTLAFGVLPAAAAQPVAQLTDAEVLALSEAHLSDSAAGRLSQLLKSRRSKSADPAQDAALIQTYRSLWLRQSEALAEAVKRGLRPPLEP